MRTDLNTVVHNYDLFEAALAKAIATLDPNEPLFTLERKHANTAKLDVWGPYLLRLSLYGERVRAHFACRTCRAFLDRYASLHTISPDGTREFVLGRARSLAHSAGPYNTVIEAVLLHMRRRKSPLKSVPFLARDPHLGYRWVGGWSHLHGTFPKDHVSLAVPRGLTALQAMAAKREDIRLLTAELTQRRHTTYRIAEAVLAAVPGTVSETALARVLWLREIVGAVKQIGNQRSSSRNAVGTWGTPERNLVAQRAMAAPAGWCHINSSTLGQLLDAVDQELPFDRIVQLWQKLTDPRTYQRAQTAPAAQTVQRAADLFADLGAESALRMRYAQIDECDLLWRKGAVPLADLKRALDKLVQEYPTE